MRRIYEILTDEKKVNRDLVLTLNTRVRCHKMKPASS